MEPSDGGNQIFIKQEIKEEVIDEEENIWENQEPICQISIKEESKNSESEHGNEFCHDDSVFPVAEIWLRFHSYILVSVIVMTLYTTHHKFKARKLIN